MFPCSQERESYLTCRKRNMPMSESEFSASASGSSLSTSCTVLGSLSVWASSTASLVHSSRLIWVLLLLRPPANDPLLAAPGVLLVPAVPSCKGYTTRSLLINSPHNARHIRINNHLLSQWSVQTTNKTGRCDWQCKQTCTMKICQTC